MRAFDENCKAEIFEIGINFNDLLVVEFVFFCYFFERKVDVFPEQSEFLPIGSNNCTMLSEIIIEFGVS